VYNKKLSFSSASEKKKKKNLWHFRNITKPDTDQGIHHRLPAAKVLCLTALKRRPRPPSLARFGYAL